MDMKIIVTISREYGSNGKEIGRLLAQKLGISYYDKSILENLAKNMGVNSDFFKDENLNREGMFSLAGSFRTNVKMLTELSLSTQAYDQGRAILQDLVKKDNAVIVGRCSNFILKDHPGQISVYCYGELEDRLKRVIEEYNVPASKARKVVLDTHAKRAKHYEYYTHQKWGQLDDFDVTINTSKQSMEETIDLLVELYHQKEKKLQERSK